jgi:hypothetical protein
MIERQSSSNLVLSEEPSSKLYSALINFEYWSGKFVSLEAFHFFSAEEELVLADSILSYRICNQHELAKRTGQICNNNNNNNNNNKKTPCKNIKKKTKPGVA